MHAGKEWPLSLSGLPASVAFGQQHPRSWVPGVPATQTVEGDGHRSTGHDNWTCIHVTLSDAFLLFFFIWTMITRCFIFVMTYIHVFFSLRIINPSGQFGGFDVSNVTLTRRWLASYRCAAKTKCSKTLAFVCTFSFCFLALHWKEYFSRRCWCAFLDSL